MPFMKIADETEIQSTVLVFLSPLFLSLFEGRILTTVLVAIGYLSLYSN
jgi:hypothetical protein